MTYYVLETTYNDGVGTPTVTAFDTERAAKQKYYEVLSQAALDNNNDMHGAMWISADLRLLERELFDNTLNDGLSPFDNEI